MTNLMPGIVTKLTSDSIIFATSVDSNYDVVRKLSNFAQPSFTPYLQWENIVAPQLQISPSRHHELKPLARSPTAQFQGDQGGKFHPLTRLSRGGRHLPALFCSLSLKYDRIYTYIGKPYLWDHKLPSISHFYRIFGTKNNIFSLLCLHSFVCSNKNLLLKQPTSSTRTVSKSSAQPTFDSFCPGETCPGIRGQIESYSVSDGIAI